MAELSVVIPCILNHLYPQTAGRSVKVLEKLGYTVLISEKQGCCGYPFLQNGEKEPAKELAQKFLFDFQTGRRNHKIVPLSPHCHYTISRNYPQLFHNSVSHNLCQKVLSDVTDVFDIIISHNLVVKPKDKALLVIDSISDLEKIRKLTEFDTPHSNWIVKDFGYSCIGASGGLPKHNEAQARECFLTHANFAIQNGLDTLVFTDEFSMLHADHLIETEKLSFKTLHLFDTLYEQLLSEPLR